MVMSPVHQVWQKSSCNAQLKRGGKKTMYTDEDVGRQHQGVNRPGVHQVQEGGEEEGKMEETGYGIICGAPTTIAVKG